MANLDYISPNTYTSLSTTGATGHASNVRQLWRKGALLAEQSTDFFQDMESKSQTGIIWAQTDTSKGNGAIMNFTTQSGFYKLPKLGDALFEASADFEKIRQSNFQLKVDYARWAVRTNKRMEEIMGMRGDIESGVNVELGKNLGRFKTEQVFGMFMMKLPPENVMYAGGKSLDSLMSADIFKWDEVVGVGQAMLPMGGLPANIAGQHASGPIWSQTFVATTPALTSLKLDSAWRDVLKNGDVRGGGNTVFKGGYPSIDGHTIVPYNPIDHDGEGPMGSFLNPKAFLGTNIGAATTAVDITGGGSTTVDTTVDYFRYFAGSPYYFIDTLMGTGANGYTQDTTSIKFVIIYNITGASAGKWGMYAFAVNDGFKLTMVGRLGVASTLSGCQLNIMGGVGYSSSTGLGGTSPADAKAQGVLYSSTVNTDVHPAGSLIIPCNCSGVPIGDSLALGQAALLRGYGEFRAEHTTDMLNGKFVTDRYLTSTFGQTFKYDRKNRVTSAMRLRHAITYPGIKLPLRG